MKKESMDLKEYKGSINEHMNRKNEGKNDVNIFYSQKMKKLIFSFSELHSL